MARKLENYLPPVMEDGLATDKAVAFGSTLAVTGLITATGGVSGAVAGAVTATTLASTGVTELSTTSKSGVRYGTTTTDLDAQSGTAAIAELLGGIYTHNSKTGAGTLTTPTGTQISAGITNVAVGYTFDCLYYNRGNQTVTLTAGASGITLYGTVAITTGKTALMRFVNTSANTWSCYCVASG